MDDTQRAEQNEGSLILGKMHSDEHQKRSPTPHPRPSPRVSSGRCWICTRGPWRSPGRPPPCPRISHTEETLRIQRNGFLEPERIQPRKQWKVCKKPKIYEKKPTDVIISQADNRTKKAGSSLAN